MATWTTATIVKERVKGSSLPSTDEILTMIQETENYICALARDNLLTTLSFDAAKHGILREVVTNIVAAKVIAENPANYASTAEASLAADVFWATAKKDERILILQETITYLKGL